MNRAIQRAKIKTLAARCAAALDCHRRVLGGASGEWALQTLCRNCLIRQSCPRDYSVGWPVKQEGGKLGERQLAAIRAATRVFGATQWEAGHIAAAE